MLVLICYLRHAQFGRASGLVVVAKRFSLCFKHFKLDYKVLGSGSCKVVYLAKKLETGESVAWSQIGYNKKRDADRPKAAISLKTSLPVSREQGEGQNACVGMPGGSE